MELSPSLNKEIVDFLLSLPAIQDSKKYQALIVSAGLDQALQNQIEITGSPGPFFQNLVPILLRYGTLEDGRYALEAFLEATKGYIGTNRQEECNALIQKLQPLRVSEISQTPTNTTISPPDKEPDIPFTNRQDEIDSILSSTAPANYVIDAPAGYGKTHFLKELQSRFRERGWACAYAFVKREQSLIKLAQDLACDLECNIQFDVGLTGRQLGAGLAKEIQQISSKGFNERGLVIMVDLEHGISKSFIQELTGEFVKGMRSRLHLLWTFMHQPNRFRLILAGRHISPLIPESFPNYKHLLTPFTYEAVRDTTETYLCPTTETQFVSDIIPTLAAHMIFLTGGHPQCMARTLVSYCTSGYEPDEFIAIMSEKVRSCVLKVTDDIQYEIPRELRNFFNDLCIYRYFDEQILDNLREQGFSNFQKIEDVNNLLDQLTQTYLVDRDGRLFRDDITRRLLAIRLRYDIGQKEFDNRCQKAQEVYVTYLDKHTYTPERWTIEYLFQYLQQHVHDAQSSSVREELRENFFDNILPFILKRLTNGHISRNPVQEKNALLETLKKDWEFRFMVNYTLRDNVYDDTAYQKCLQRINQGML